MIGSLSFYEFLRREHPNLLPQFGLHLAEGSNLRELQELSMRGTSIIAIKYRDGVVITADTRVTSGEGMTSSESARKIFKINRYSAVAFAGSWSIVQDIAKLLKKEVSYYQRIACLEYMSIRGIAERLSAIMKGNFPLIEKGLIVVPVLVGYDCRQKAGRLFSFDALGGMIEEVSNNVLTAGGGLLANVGLDEYEFQEIGEAETVKLVVEKIIGISRKHQGTGGIDFKRKIFPSVFVITKEGTRGIPLEEMERIASEILNGDRR